MEESRQKTKTFPLARDQGTGGAGHRKYDDMAYAKHGVLQRWKRSVRLSICVPLDEPNAKEAMLRSFYQLLPYVIGQ